MNMSYKDKEGVEFDNSNKTILICYPTEKSGSYTIPNTVKWIEMGAFLKCPNLTSITIPAGIGIEERAFDDTLQQQILLNGTGTYEKTETGWKYKRKTVPIPALPY
jgi:hypothetical protein